MSIETCEQTARRSLVGAARQLAEQGYNLNAEGNLSMRQGASLLVTPGGIAAVDLRPEDIVILDTDGHVVGSGKPSSEWRLHAELLNNRPESNAVVHTHALFCSVLACQRRDIPAFHYMVAAFGGPTIRCAEYATFGSRELATHALAALRNRWACLLANHGAVSLGYDLEQAVSRMAALEKLAHQYWLSLAHGGPVLLDPGQMEQVESRFRHYGDSSKALKAGQDKEPVG